MMTAQDVLALYHLFEKHGITVWLDGGWCVDALLGAQTRAHVDLDVAVARQDNARLRALLEREGYQEAPRDDSSAWMYVMENARGNALDIHVFAYDEQGHVIYGVPYPYGSLAGTGMIDGQEVRCVSPEWMFTFKTGYQPQEKDLHDVRALSQKFGFALPERYGPMSE